MYLDDAPATRIILHIVVMLTFIDFPQVFEGFAIPHATFSMSGGGNDVTDELYRLCLQHLPKEAAESLESLEPVTKGR